MTQIYISRNGIQEGPFALDYIKDLFVRGELKSDDYAWYEGCSDWIAVSEIPNIVDHSIDIFEDLELKHLKSQIEEAQYRLAEVESVYGVEKRKIDVLRAKLFEILRKFYEERDRLRLIVRYRKEFVDKVLHSSHEEASKVEEQFRAADAEREKAYASAAEKLSKKKVLSVEEEAELRTLWKKLVKLFHPDLVRDDPAKAETFHRLTQAINEAKANGDLDSLREIANDPDGFMRKKGWAKVDLGHEGDIESLKAQLYMLERQIAEAIDATEKLKKSKDFELLKLCQKDESVLETVTDKQRAQIDAECQLLTTEAEELQKQIESLTGKNEMPIR
jgi:DNA polymerase-3 subunit epsilon